MPDKSCKDRLQKSFSLSMKSDVHINVHGLHVEISSKVTLSLKSAHYVRYDRKGTYLIKLDQSRSLTMNSKIWCSWKYFILYCVIA